MSHPKHISIQDYTYNLPVEKIALHPLNERDASKLLVYRDGKIEQDTYKNIAQYLPAESFLVFNNTKVIKARLRFKKSSGGVIEIFCLEPFESINDYSVVMNKKASVRWKCMIGGLSKWKEELLQMEVTVGNENLQIKARLIEKHTDAHIVEFNWLPAEKCFAEVLELFGDIPLPPYIKRKTGQQDADRYQTIYAKDQGSVAAPTAGLHFTQEVFKSLSQKNIETGFITLHVGAGTFKPVKATTMQHHEMHAEWIDIGIAFIEKLITQLDKNIVSVGTTSLRSIESLYWMGVKAYLQPSLHQLSLSQWEVYEAPLAPCRITAKDALMALLNWLKNNNHQRLFTQSQILIAPGYSFKIANAIVTNFHQPQSTLLLLVAAVIGKNATTEQANWRIIYDYALQNDFRFLSYGDGSLLFIAH
ncbi:MAG: S-adenosylmethionine:tRNA ribosyltransferase-isomerase [Chitinophagaceae bacterium]|nr:S-adenosylmethionine:tRNA ribosyltransferase-isomerase [Chitinophagaceae bacterium]